MSDYIAQKPFSGNAAQTLTFSNSMNAFVITNDGSSNLTFTINGDTYTLRAGFTFDEVVNPYKSVTISATGEYFGYCRRSTSEFR